jgi:hypothetical protein
MWPKQILWVFGFKPGDSVANPAFVQSRQRAVEVLPDWSHLVFTPDDVDNIVAALPVEDQAHAQQAMTSKKVKWVEKNDILRACVLFIHGGLVVDGLDVELQLDSIKQLAEYRSNILLVNGNDRVQVCEPDVVGSCYQDHRILVCFEGDAATRPDTKGIHSRYWSLMVYRRVMDEDAGAL